MRPRIASLAALLLAAWLATAVDGGVRLGAAQGGAVRRSGSIAAGVPATRVAVARGSAAEAAAAGEASRVPVVHVPPAVRVGVNGTQGYAVRSIDIEEYVAGVLTGEAARDSDPAVLQALAVAIRTYALKNLNRHRAEGFDVCDETHCQVLRRPTAASTAAAQATAGQVLTWQGALAIVYYSASCGGHSQVPSAVWPGAEDPPYLPARSDDGCEGDPVWNAELRTSDLEKTLRANGFRGTLKRMRIAARDRSGRVTRLTLDGMRPSSVPGTNLRMAVGPTVIKSMTFEVRQDRDRYLFGGRGYGHGVGMCVIGATKLAAKGETAAALLARYYPGTVLGLIDTGSGLPSATVATITGGTVSPPAAAAPAMSSPGPSTAPPSAAIPAVVPPAGRATGDSPAPGGALADRREVDRLVTLARTDLAGRLGVTATGQVPVVVHASDDAYEKSTGRHWFTFGAFVRGELHLMPIEQLRQRGLLERVIRREMVHALADPVLAGRAQWVRDGAALYFSDPQAVAAELSRDSCPSDLDLLQPVSAGALAQAYGRARQCFERQVTNGRAWRDVR